MKFLHTSDWHLGARLGEYSRLPEQRLVLEEIRKIAEQESVDFVLIAGDIFDNFNPPNEAVELLYRELKKLSDGGKRPVVAIAGNHDSPDRIEAPDPLAAECGIFFAGYPDFLRPPKALESGVRADFPEEGIIRVDIPDRPPLRLIVTPYANENRLRKILDADRKEEHLSEVLHTRWAELAEKYCDGEGVNVLAAHLFMSDGKRVPDEPEEERSILHPGGLEMIDASLVPSQIQYTALGHLHRPAPVRSSGSPIVYSGSPLAFGLSEEDQQKSVTIVEAEPGGEALVREVPLDAGRRILRRRFEGTDAAVEWLSENPGCYVELIIECENYISAEDRRRLHEVHDGITAVIPQSLAAGAPSGGEDDDGLPDIGGSLEDLFRSYFRYSKGMDPDEDLMSVFREAASRPGDSE